MRKGLIMGLGVCLGGCASVQLDTPEPLQVDIHMKVDVEQKGGDGEKGKNETLSVAEEKTIIVWVRQRMAL
jgi:hypothetical protein